MLVPKVELERARSSADGGRASTAASGRASAAADDDAEDSSVQQLRKYQARRAKLQRKEEAFKSLAFLRVLSPPCDQSQDKENEGVWRSLYFGGTS